MTNPNRLIDIVDRISIKDVDDCWNWQGSTCTNGYGQFYMSGVVYMAHRLSWQYHNGAIPDRVLVLHTCDNRLCCNPKHLFLGDHTDNAKDMIAKGRCPERSGQNNGRAKLNAVQVREIKERLLYGNSVAHLARTFGVSWETINCIKTGKTWRNV